MNQNPPLDKPHKRLLATLGAGWMVTGAIGALWAAARVRDDDGGLAAFNAWCVELAFFGYVCWLLLGVMLGFPLYYWLTRRDADPGVDTRRPRG